jgi:hypothetical protein
MAPPADHTDSRRGSRRDRDAPLDEGLTPMGPGESILGSLRIAARHIRHRHRVRDAAWGSAALLVILACGVAVERFVADAPIVDALHAMLVIGAFAIAIGVGVKLWLRPSLASVARGVDAAAGRHDEFKSAYWFATQDGMSPFAEAHVQRAVAVAQGLAWSRLFPPTVPRRAAMVAAAAVAAMGLAWSLPASRPDVGGASDETVAIGRVLSGGAAEGERPSGSDDAGAMSPETGRQRAASELWKQIEALAGGLSERTEGRTLAEAIAARDARAAAEAVRAERSDRRAPVSGGGAAEGPGEQMTDALAQGILERLANLLKAEQQPPTARDAASDEAERPTARLDRELRADQDDAQPGAKREQSAGEDALNTSLRALSRRGTAGRDAVHGEAEATEGAGRANVGGGAMGRRVGVSTGGAGDGDQPVGNLVAPEQDDQVLGRRTERLAVQLKAVKVPESAADDADNAPTGAEESFFAATRAQAARIGFRAAGGPSRSDAEGAAALARPSVADRDAVKRYTLTRHRRDADARAADEAR